MVPSKIATDALQLLRQMLQRTVFSAGSMKRESRTVPVYDEQAVYESWERFREYDVEDGEASVLVSFAMGAHYILQV